MRIQYVAIFCWIVVFIPHKKNQQMDCTQIKCVGPYDGIMNHVQSLGQNTKWWSDSGGKLKMAKFYSHIHRQADDIEICISLQPKHTKQGGGGCQQYSFLLQFTVLRHCPLCVRSLHSLDLNISASVPLLQKVTNYMVIYLVIIFF